MGILVRNGGLNLAVPKLRKHMSEQRCALTSKTAAEVLGVTKPTAHNILFYMEATDSIQRVKRGISFYFLKNTYNEAEIEVILRKSGARERHAKPKKWVRRRQQKNASLIEEHMADVRAQAASGEGPSALAILGITYSDPTELQAVPKTITSQIEPKKNLEPQLFGTVSMLPKSMRRITAMQVRYLKDNYLKYWPGLDQLNTFFADGRALKRGEYGSVIFAATGTNPWERVRKLTLDPDVYTRNSLPGIEKRRWNGWAKFLHGVAGLGKIRYNKKQYGQILDQLLEDKYELVEVNVEDRTPGYMRIVLSALIAERDLDVKAYVKDKTLYLKRVHND